MPSWLAPDWGEMFRPDQPILETFLRGTVTYLAIVLLMRAVPKRQSGSVGLGDMLLVVLIADAAQNAMAGAYRSIPNGLVLVGTLLFWSYALDAVCYRWEFARRLLDPSPRCLIRDGRPLRDSLERERITEDELLGQLRLKGFESFAQVREARIESEGHISVLPRRPRDLPPGAPRPPAPGEITGHRPDGS